MIKNSLLKKMSLSIFLTIFVFGLMASFAVFYYSKKVFTQQETLVFKDIVKAQAHEISHLFLDSENLAEKIAEREFVVDYLSGDNRTEKEGDFVLEQLNSYNVVDLYSAIYLLDVDGNTLLSTDSSFAGNNYSFRDYFKKIEQQTTDRYLDASIGVTSGELGYYASRSVLKDGVFVGVVVLKLRPESVHNFLHFNNESRFGYVSLVDDYGVVIASNRQEYLYKSIVKLSDTEIDYVYKKRRFPNIEISPIGYDLIRTDLTRVLGPKVFNIDNVEGRRSVLVMSKVENYPFFVVIEEKTVGIGNIILSSSRNLGLLVFLFAFLASIVMFFINRYFFMPLWEMNDVLKKVVGGDVGQRILIRRGDEFGEIGRSCNKVIARLQDCFKNTDTEVYKRTKQLEEVNNVLVGRELKMIELKKELSELKKKLAKK